MTMDDAVGQQDQDTHSAADETDVDADDVTDEDQDDAQVDVDDDDQGQDGDQQQDGRRNREPQLRRRAQAAEAERDRLRTQLDALHRQMVSGIANRAGLPEVELLQAAGYDLASFITDEGTVDHDKVIDATQATMRRYNIRKGNALASNPQQGGRNAPVSTGGVGDVIKAALGR
jgi:hypothetical protein